MPGCTLTHGSGGIGGTGHPLSGANGQTVDTLSL
jgi:hypothetical protein